MSSYTVGTNVLGMDPVIGPFDAADFTSARILLAALLEDYLSTFSEPEGVLWEDPADVDARAELVRTLDAALLLNAPAALTAAGAAWWIVETPDAGDAA